MFEHKGYRDTTIRDIAKAADISVGTVYQYYKGKEDILKDVGDIDAKNHSLSYEKKRCEIMDAALTVFGEKGYSRTNIEDIANLTSMTKGNIYQYFKSKEELFISMIRETALLKFVWNMDNEYPTEDPEQLLSEIGKGFLAIYKDPRRLNLMRIIISESPIYPEIGTLFCSEVTEKASDILGKVLKPHLPSQADAVLSARIFFGSLWSFIITQEIIVSGGAKYEDDKIVKEIIRIFFNGAFNI